MTLLTIAEAVAKDVGVKVPTAVIGETSRTIVELLEYITKAVEEIVRRVDWGEMTAETTLTGDGTNKTHTITGLHRLIDGPAIVHATTGPVRMIPRAIWDTLTHAEGDPRYALLEGDELRFWPYLANADTVDVSYLTLNWCSNGTGAFAADSDTCLINEDLVAKGAIVIWRRQKGMEHAEQSEDYESELTDLAEFNDGGAS